METDYAAMFFFFGLVIGAPVLGSLLALCLYRKGKAYKSPMDPWHK